MAGRAVCDCAAIGRYVQRVQATPLHECAALFTAEEAVCVLDILRAGSAVACARCTGPGHVAPGHRKKLRRALESVRSHGGAAAKPRSASSLAPSLRRKRTAQEVEAAEIVAALATTVTTHASRPARTSAPQSPFVRRLVTLLSEDQHRDACEQEMTSFMQATPLKELGRTLRSVDRKFHPRFRQLRLLPGHRKKLEKALSLVQSLPAGV